MADKKDATVEPDAAASLAREMERRPAGMIREFWGLLRHNKKWWLAPIIIATLLLGVLMFLFGTPAAPLIYTLF